MLNDTRIKRKGLTKEFTVILDAENAVDVRMFVNGEVSGFVLNLRCRFGDVWHAVYRVDTCHKYLHEQRFWVTPEPIALPVWEGRLKHVFVFYMNQIKENFGRYRRYYAEKLGDEK